MIEQTTKQKASQSLYNGRHIPSQCLLENRQSDMLWLRLSGLAQGNQRLYYLEMALQVNPKNKQALRLIERIDPERGRQARMWIDVFSEIIHSV